MADASAAATTSSDTAATDAAAAAANATATAAADTSKTGASATADGASTSGDAAKPGAKAQNGAVADIEVKLPEGVTADDVLLGKFKPMAKDLGLKSEGAQKLVDLFVEHQASWMKRANAEWRAERDEWKAQLKADKDFSGENLDKSLATINKAMQQFGSPELKKLLDGSELGNHPVIARFLLNVGKKLGEDSVAGASATASTTAASDKEAFLKQLYDKSFDQMKAGA